MNKKYRRLHPSSPQTHVLRVLITHTGTKIKIEQIVNVHEIQHHVYEMFTVHPSETHFHKAHNQLTNS